MERRHTVRITSHNAAHNVIEWTETVEAATKAAAMRKAWRVVADCGASRDECAVSGNNNATLIDIT